MVEFEKVDMDEFIAGCVQRFCSVCGTQIRQKETGRPRKFCSDPCRRRYWKAHPKPEQWNPWIDPDRGSRPAAVEEMEICIMERYYDTGDFGNADRELS